MNKATSFAGSSSDGRQVKDKRGPEFSSISPDNKRSREHRTGSKLIYLGIKT